MTFGSDNPRKAKPASNVIAAPTNNADCTIIGAAALGKITLKIRAILLLPEEREAKTKSSSFILKNSHLVILATVAQLTAPIARVIESTDEPNSATITMANNKVGKT